MKKSVQDIRDSLIELEKVAADYLFVQNAVYAYLEKVLSQYQEDGSDYPDEIDHILSTIDDHTNAIWDIQDSCKDYLERTKE